MVNGIFWIMGSNRLSPKCFSIAYFVYEIYSVIFIIPLMVSVMVFPKVISSGERRSLHLITLNLIGFPMKPTSTHHFILLYRENFPRGLPASRSRVDMTVMTIQQLITVKMSIMILQSSWLSTTTGLMQKQRWTSENSFKATTWKPFSLWLTVQVSLVPSRTTSLLRISSLQNVLKWIVLEHYIFQCISKSNFSHFFRKQMKIFQFLSVPLFFICLFFTVSSNSSTYQSLKLSFFLFSRKKHLIL